MMVFVASLSYLLHFYHICSFLKELKILAYGYQKKKMNFLCPKLFWGLFSMFSFVPQLPEQCHYIMVGVCRPIISDGVHFLEWTIEWHITHFQGTKLKQGCSN